jgi:hypothetical protein
MPPRRGWGIFGLGFYKDVAPMALGKMLDRKTIERKLKEISKANETDKHFFTRVGIDVSNKSRC